MITSFIILNILVKASLRCLLADSGVTVEKWLCQANVSAVRAFNPARPEHALAVRLHAPAPIATLVRIQALGRCNANPFRY